MGIRLDEKEFERTWSEWFGFHDIEVLQSCYEQLLPVMKYTFRHYVEKSYYDDLFQEMYLLLPRMLELWSPEKGKAFSYFHTAFANKARTFIKKERNINSNGKNPTVDPDIMDDNEDIGQDVEETFERNTFNEVIDNMECRIDKNLFDYILFRTDQPTAKLVREVKHEFKVSMKQAKFAVEYTRTKARIELTKRGLTDYVPVDEKILIEFNGDTTLPELFNLLGVEAFTHMIRIFGGMKVKFPTIDMLYRTEMEDKVTKALKKGFRGRDIEKRLGVNDYLVKKCWKNLPRKPRG